MVGLEIGLYRRGLIPRRHEFKFIAILGLLVDVISEQYGNHGGYAGMAGHLSLPTPLPIGTRLASPLRTIFGPLRECWNHMKEGSQEWLLMPFCKDTKNDPISDLMNAVIIWPSFR